MRYILGLILILIATGCSGRLDSGAAASPKPQAATTGTGGSLARFAITGNTLYTVDNQSLNVFDLTIPESPEFKTKTSLRADIETIFGRDTVLFIGSQSGMYIYSIQNPLAPKQLSLYQHIVSCDPVVADGKYAYITLRARPGSNFCNRGLNQLEVIDISDLTKPAISQIYPLKFPIGLGIDQDLLFVCDEGLKVYNAKETPKLTLLKHFKIGDAQDVIPFDNLLIVTATEGIYQYSYAGNTIEKLSFIGVGSQ